MRIVVLEGINAAGKSSVASQIQNVLERAGRPCLSVDPAGFGQIGQSLRKHLVEPQTISTPNFDTMLFAALRMEGALAILKAVKSKPPTTIVLERWSLALLAYGSADGARPELVSELRTVLRDILTIGLTVLLDLSGADAYRRIEQEAHQNRFESKGPEYLDSVAQSYRRSGSSEPGVSIVDASYDRNTTFRNVWEALKAKWDDLNGIATPD